MHTTLKVRKVYTNSAPPNSSSIQGVPKNPKTIEITIVKI